MNIICSFKNSFTKTILVFVVLFSFRAEAQKLIDTSGVSEINDSFVRTSRQCSASNELQRADAYVPPGHKSPFSNHHSPFSDIKSPHRLMDTSACPGLSGTVYVGAGLGTPSYPTFNGSGGLFEDINNKALSGNLTVIVQQKDIMEPASATLLNPVAYCTGGPYKILIQPAGDSLFTISGSSVSPALIGFNGAAHVYIDGQFNGDGKQWLKFLNTNPGSNNVLLFRNNTFNISVKHCVLDESSASSSTGIVNFSTSDSVGKGNSYIILESNLIGSSGGAACIIYSNGSAASPNHDNTIISNHIFNFSSATNAFGINITSTGNGSNWNISNNSFYNIPTCTFVNQTAINFLPGSSSNDNIISNNIIGGKNEQALGGWWENSAVGTTITAIKIDAGTIIVASNVIQNIQQSSLNSGWIVGIDILGSTKPVIQNNILYWIYNRAGGLAKKVCDQWDPMSGMCTHYKNEPTGQVGWIYGLRSFTSSTLTITGNTLSNLFGDPAKQIDATYYNNYLGNCVRGLMHTGSGNFNIYENTFKDLESSTGWTFYNAPSANIYIINTGLATAVDGCNISDNIIEGINAPVTRKVYAPAIKNTGIYVAGNFGGTISKNIIYGFDNNVWFNGNGGGNEGIHIKLNSLGTWTVSNNQISMGYLGGSVDGQRASQFGIIDEASEGATINVFYNTIHIQGVETAIAVNYSAPFRRNTNSADALNIKNNIFLNSRTNGNGSQAVHYGISNIGSAGAAGWDSDNNFIATGLASSLGQLGASVYDSTNWKSVSGGDINSSYALAISIGKSDTANVNPAELFINPDTDLHLIVPDTIPPKFDYPLAFIVGLGKPVSILDDYDGKIRSVNSAPAGTTMGIQEIETCIPALFTSQPVSSPQLCAPASASFTVAASGDGEIAYQWQVNNGSWENITDGGINPEYSGALTPTLNVDSAFSDIKFRCIVTNCPGINIISDSVEIPVMVKPEINYISPDKIKCLIRDTALFKVVASGKDLSYHWLKSGVEIEGATDTSYYIDLVLATDEGVYSCIVTNSCGSDTLSCSLTTLTSPLINSNIDNISQCEGLDLNINVSASGSDLKYQWTKDDENIPGATDSQFSVLNSKFSDAGVYSCIINNICKSVTLKPFIVTVIRKPYITTAPVTLEKNVNESVEFNLSPSGSSPFSYEWLKNGESIPGQTSNIYQLSSIICDDAGTYSCIITNLCGSSIVQVSTLIVKNCNKFFTVEGFVLYDKKTITPIKNVTVYLVNSEGLKIDSAQTDINGFYQFINAPEGIYKLSTINYQLNWGGSNPLDALFVNRSYLGTYTFVNPFREVAANVNDDGTINPVDALLINKRYSGTITKFTIADWLFDSPDITVFGANVTQNIKALCAGDVDASYPKKYKKFKK